MNRNVLLLRIVFVVHCFNVGLIRAQFPKVCLSGSTCVLGKFMPGFQTHLFEAFVGIPYAKPPIGDLRFRNPVEAELWQGTLVTRDPKPDCIQKDYIRAGSTIRGSENCLYLNVYRPLNTGYKNLPVLFYIHAGGLASGSASPMAVGPQYFMDTGEVILVAAAFRVGPFGFLSTNDEEMPGNFGFKDQTLALQWIQKYIHLFGGDPDRVTLFGNSAGSTAVHFHLLSPASQDLFRNAMMISSSANAPFAAPKGDPRDKVIELAEAVGISDAAHLNSTGLVKLLRRINPTVLVRAIDKMKVWNIHPFGVFRPNIEQSSWKGAFITANLSSLTIEKPWVVGHVSAKGEGVVLAHNLASNVSLRAEFNKRFDTLLPVVLELADDIDEAAFNRTIDVYMGGEHNLNNRTLDGFLELLGDESVNYPAYKAIESHLNSARTHTLKGIIRYEYRGPYSYSNIFTSSNIDYGAVHGDDSLFLFRVPKAFPKGYPMTSYEAVLVKQYVELNIEFAKTGKVKMLEDLGKCTKELFAKGACKYLHIVNQPEVYQTGSTWPIDRMKLWDDVYKVGKSPTDDHT